MSSNVLPRPRSKRSRHLLLHQASEFVQEIDCLSRARDPRCRAHASSSEVIRSGAEELVSDVQRMLALDPAALCGSAEPRLSDGYSPALVANVDEHVVPAVEGTERHAPCPADRRGLQDLLHH